MKRTLLLLAVGSAFLWVSPVSAQSRQATASAPTFNKDVAPILFNNCITCHRPGEIAPMSLLTYKEARPWAKGIKAKVAAREMPPWFADPRYGKFKNARGLTRRRSTRSSHGPTPGRPKVRAGADAENNSAARKLGRSTDSWTGRQIPVVVSPFDAEIPADGRVHNWLKCGVRRRLRKTNTLRRRKSGRATASSPTIRRSVHRRSHAAPITSVWDRHGEAAR